MQPQILEIENSNLESISPHYEGTIQREKTFHNRHLQWLCQAEKHVVCVSEMNSHQQKELYVIQWGQSFYEIKFLNMYLQHGFHQVWYQGGAKSTVSGVFEDLKFKTSILVRGF